MGIERDNEYRAWMYQTWERLAEQFGRESAAERLAHLLPHVRAVQNMAAYAREQAEEIRQRCKGDKLGTQGRLSHARYLASAEVLEGVADRVDAAVRENVRGSFG
jgi:hypothetical protein